LPSIRTACELGDYLAELLFELVDVDFDQHGLRILQCLRSGVADTVERRKPSFLRDEVLRIPFDGEPSEPRTA